MGAQFAPQLAAYIAQNPDAKMTQVRQELAGMMRLMWWRVFGSSVLTHATSLAFVRHAPPAHRQHQADMQRCLTPLVLNLLLYAPALQGALSSSVLLQAVAVVVVPSPPNDGGATS